MAEDLNNFLGQLQSRLVQTAQTQAVLTPQKDDQLDYFCTPAPNAIEWAVSPEYADVPTIYHHRRQYQVIRDFFQLRCPLPTCNNQSDEAKDCWGKEREYLESENLLVWSAKYEEDVCPHCNTTRSEFIQDGLLKIYNQMNVVAGMRSGKTATAGIIGTYIEHRVITIGHKTPGGLSQYFNNQLPKQPFEITFIASTDVQSADTIWARFTSLRQQSQWIQKYIRWIKAEELKQSTPNGAKPWTYVEQDKQIIHGFLHLKLNSLNSNSGGMAGRTRPAAFVDELARFDNTESKRSGDEAYRVLENSLRTIRTPSMKNKATPWLGTMISISSPISEDDKSMRLLRQANEIKGMYSGHWATWEFNPDQPREAFDDDFAKDPIGAMRDFGAKPPTAISPLIEDPMRFRELAIQKDLAPTSRFKRIIHTDPTGREYVSALVESAQLLRNGERYICFDAGSSFDQFAGACAHGEWVHTPEGRQLITVYDWVYRLIPERQPRRDVWFDFVVSAIEHLSKYYYIGRVEFDRWQSTYLIQQIRNRGILCEMKSTTADQFIKLISDVTYSKVRMLPPDPDDHKLDPPYMSAPGLAFYELEHLERSPDLKKVYNPKKGQKRGWDSDDVATVVAHVNSMCQAAVVDIGNSNSVQSRLRREAAGSYGWESGGTLFRPRMSKRNW
jgi:hypothetical protein